MWWKWLIFGLIFILAPSGVINLYVMASKKQSLTDEQKKKAGARMVELILYYWLVAFFYMVSFNHWLIWQFVLGILILLVFFTGLAGAVSSPAKKGSIITFSNLLDLVIGIGVSVYLIYIIPNKQLKDILTPIVAAVYGGLLTLVGVAWTIRKNEKDKKEEEIEKAKPYLQLISSDMIDNKGEKYDSRVGVSFYKAGESIIDPQRILHIKNVGGLFILEAIKFDYDYKRCKKTLIAENNVLSLMLKALKYNVEGETVDVKLYGHDKLNNYYCFTIENKIEKQENSFRWELDCISMPIKLEEQEIKEIYKELEKEESDNA